MLISFIFSLERCDEKIHKEKKPFKCSKNKIKSETLFIHLKKKGEKKLIQ